MRILLVNTNFEPSPNPTIKKPIPTVAPIGLAYLSFPLKQKGYCVEMFDLSKTKDPEIEFKSTLNNFKPTVVGFSIRNTDNHAMLAPFSPLPKIKKYVQIVNKKHITTVLGGTAFSAFPETMIKYMNASYGIVGQGEKSFTMLVESIFSKKINFEQTIPGLFWQDGGEIKSNLPSLSGYKNVKPDLDLFDYKQYKFDLWTGSVVIKTGCPYNCLYCEAPRLGKQFIPREHDEIIDEIKYLKEKQNIETFYFIDNCFNSPLNSAKELLYKIIKSDLNIHPFCQISPRKDCYDNELFELYRKAGGVATFIGSDSFSAKMLKSYNNGFTLDSIRDCIKLALNNGILSPLRRNEK